MVFIFSLSAEGGAIKSLDNSGSVIDGIDDVRLPAFVFGPRVGVLPAFSSFTGSGMHERSDTDTTFVIAGDEVLPVRTRS